MAQITSQSHKVVLIKSPVVFKTTAIRHPSASKSPEFGRFPVRRRTERPSVTGRVTRWRGASAPCSFRCEGEGPAEPRTAVRTATAVISTSARGVGGHRVERLFENFDGRWTCDGACGMCAPTKRPKLDRSARAHYRGALLERWLAQFWNEAEV